MLHGALSPGHAVQADRRRSTPRATSPALHMRISGQSILAARAARRACRTARTRSSSRGSTAGGPEASIGYTVPNLLIDHAMRNPQVPPGFWRGVNLNQNAIYLECFMDELAHAAGQDPLEFRRKLMANHPKHLAVLNAVAERHRLGQAGAGRACIRGLAQTMGFGSYVAACAEVSVERRRASSRSTASSPPPIRGHAVNPQQIEAQVEGSFVYGLSAALYGEMHGQGRPHRAGELRHLPRDADRRDAEGRDDRRCRPAASGAASASRRSRWRRRRCSTRSSRRPASASARCR